MKNVIQDKNGLNVLVKHGKNLSQSSKIFCDKIEYVHNRGIFEVEGVIESCKVFDHHLMFWQEGKLVFKVWLRNNPRNKEYKDIHAALKDAGIRVIPRS